MLWLHCGSECDDAIICGRLIYTNGIQFNTINARKTNIMKLCKQNSKTIYIFCRMHFHWSGNFTSEQNEAACEHSPSHAGGAGNHIPHRNWMNWNKLIEVLRIDVCGGMCWHSQTHTIETRHRTTRVDGRRWRLTAHFSQFISRYHRRASCGTRIVSKCMPWKIKYARATIHSHGGAQHGARPHNGTVEIKEGLKKILN